MKTVNENVIENEGVKGDGDMDSDDMKETSLEKAGW